MYYRTINILAGDDLAGNWGVAGAGCEVWAQEMVAQTSGIYSVAALGGSLWGLKIIWGLRK